MSKNKDNNKPILGAKGLSRIPYADKPLSLGGKISYLTTEEFEKKFGCRYTEDLYGDPRLNAQVREERKKRGPTEAEAKILHRLENPLDSLVICYVNQEIGHVVIANQDFDEIGTILALYAGEIAPIGKYSEIGMDYAAALDGKKMSGDKVITSDDEAVLAYRIGGIARFMPDLPYDYEGSDQAFLKAMRIKYPLESYPQATDDFILSAVQNEKRRLTTKDLAGEIKFHSPTIRKKLAFSNIHREQTIFFGIPIVILKVNYPIKKGEVIGFIYSENYSYWKAKKRLPCLLTKHGEVIDKSSYHFAPEGHFYQKITDVSDMDSKNSVTLALQMYEQGVSAFKASCWGDAKTHVERALSIFQQIPDVERQAVICLSTLISCFRELKQFDIALESWEQAMLLTSLLDKDKIRQKIESCLPELTGLKLHESAINQYKKGNYKLAILELNFAIEKFTQEEKLGLGKKAKSLSVLASCHRQLGELTEARRIVTEAHELALAVFGAEHSVTLQIQAKKDKLPNSSLPTSVAAAIAMSSIKTSTSTIPNSLLKMEL